MTEWYDEYDDNGIPIECACCGKSYWASLVEEYDVSYDNEHRILDVKCPYCSEWMNLEDNYEN